LINDWKDVHVTGTGAAFDDVTRLIELAAAPQLGERADIYQAVASLYRTQGPRLSERERQLMREILRRLTTNVEMGIRIATAETIAADPEAPLDLILFLVNDKIEVARPLILRSHRLSDAELLAFIAEADVARRALCAERPNIGEPVTDVLARSHDEAVLVALVRNVTARIAPQSFELLVEKSRNLRPLQEPLVHRSDLPPVLALKMCDWVSDALKIHLIRALHIDAAFAEESVNRGAQRIQASPSVEVAEGSWKLVEKLAIAGQLKPGFLLRVLQQGQLDLFELAFARLLELDYARTKHVLYDGGPRPVAMACRAVGIDRCVFPTVYNLSRQARRIHPLLRPDDRVDAEAVFNSYSKAEALARLQAC
jgi:uncharacterized protein (DUF2336 family)